MRNLFRHTQEISKAKLKHNTWLTKEHILNTKLLPYFKDKKMRDLGPKDIIQWQNEQISYRDDKKVKPDASS